MSTLPTSVESVEIIPIREVKKKLTKRKNTFPPGKDRLGIPSNKGLSAQQIRFIDLYLSNKCRSAYKAALEAGYSENTANIASSVLLQNPKVAAEMKRRAQAIVESVGVSPEFVIQETVKLVRANVLDYIDIEDGGKFTVNLERVDRDMGSAIQELSYDAEGRPRIRLADKKASIELLARIFKMFAEKAENPGDSRPLTIQSLDSIVQQITNVTVNIAPQERRRLPETIDAI